MEAIAQHKFQASAEDELSFEKGDCLKIVDDEEDENWYKAELNGKCGLVPSNYITQKPHPWYVSKVSRDQAEALLKSTPQPDGAFLVRRSETSPQDFSITVRAGDGVQHYKILRDSQGKFFLWVVKFSSINELIDYHRSASVSRTHNIVLKDMIHVDKKNQQQVQQQHIPSVRRVRAMYDFTPQQADEIGLKRGDIITITDTSDANWWKGVCHGKEGMFPATYVKEED